MKNHISAIFTVFAIGLGGLFLGTDLWFSSPTIRDGLAVAICIASLLCLLLLLRSKPSDGLW